MVKACVSPAAIALAISAIAWISATVGFFWASNRAFGFADEGIWLITVAAPWSYPHSASEAAYLLHPIFVLVSGDLCLFRIAGFLLLEACTLAFSVGLTKFLGDRTENRLRRSVVLTLALATLWQFSRWQMPTPHYNTLNLCGVLLFAAGLLFAAAGVKRDAIAYLLSATGMTLAALSKPTTAIALVLLGVAWLTIVRVKHPTRALIITAVSSIALYLLAVTMIAGGPVEFLRQKLAALQFLRDIGEVTAIARSLAVPGQGNYYLKLVLLGVLALIAAGIVLAWAYVSTCPSAGRSTGRTMLGFAVSAAFASALGLSRAAAPVPGEIIGISRAFHALQFLLPLGLAVFAVCLIVTRKASFDTRERRILGAAVLLSCLPIAYSSGTGAPFLLHILGAMVFWASALLALATLVPTGTRTLAISNCVFFIVFVTFANLIGFAARPFPSSLSQPLWTQTNAVAFGPGDKPIFVDDPTFQYISALRRSAADHGFIPGTPLLDFSTFGSGSVYFLNGRSPGSPFYYLDWPDGQKSAFAEAGLNRASPEDISKAWLLADETQTAKLSRLPWSRFGLSFPGSFERAGESEFSIWGVKNILWKPRHPNGTSPK